MALSGLGISLFGVNYKDDPDHGRDFLVSLGNPFERMGADPKGRNAIDWGVYGIPETFLISSDGKNSVSTCRPDHIQDAEQCHTAQD